MSDNKNIKSYFECKKCFHKFYQLIDIQRHLNKKKSCIRTLESFKFKDEDLEKISLERIYIKNKNAFVCPFCKKVYTTKKILEHHKNNVCKLKNSNIINNNIDLIKKDTTETNINNIFDEQPKNNINYQNIESQINILGNSNNVDLSKNITINNININLSSAKDFDEEWDVSKITDFKKLTLLLSESKFSKTLEEILENEVNLNVLIDNTSNSGLIFTNNSLKKMNIKEIVDKCMYKLYNHLKSFHNRMKNENPYELNTDFLDNELTKAKYKYEDYRKNKDINNKVNKLIAGIYDKKKDNTILELENTIKTKTEGY